MTNSEFDSPQLHQSSCAKMAVMAKLTKNFLDDEGESPTGLSYREGFRFGLGFMLAWLVVMLIVGGLAWAVATLTHIH